MGSAAEPPIDDGISKISGERFASCSTVGLLTSDRQVVRCRPLQGSYELSSILPSETSSLPQAISKHASTRPAAF
jgi:hypothetical protein